MVDVPGPNLGPYLGSGAGVVMRRGSCDDAVGTLRPHLRNLAQRRRSAPALALGKALGSMPWSPIREETSCWVAAEQCPFVLGLSSENGELLLDESVQVTEGTKTRQRQLFLFSDVMVIAKLKSCTSYRLKHRVNLEDLWLYGFEDEEEEEDGAGEIDLRTSLVVAWPLALCVLTFRLPEVKERWVDTLYRKIKEARERAGSTSLPPDVLMKVLTGTTGMKTLAGGGMDPSLDSQLDGDIKISALPRQLCNVEDRASQPIDNGSSKWRSLKWKLMKGSRSDNDSKTQLFGLPLSKTCPEDGTLPKPIMEMLVILWKKGPTTEGVFRKGGNSKNMKTTKEELNSGAEVDMDLLPVVQHVMLLKNFLKELPGSLLVSELYESWMEALETEDPHQKPAQLKRVVGKLPAANVLLLRHLLCVLHHISKNSDTNKMDANNLAVCIAPTLLQTSSTSLEERETLDKVTELTRFLIEHCCEIFGDNIRSLLGDPDEENSDSLQQHDSAYDSPDLDGGDSISSGSTQGSTSSTTDELLSTSSSSDCTGSVPSSSPLFHFRTDYRSAVHSCSSDAIFSSITKPVSPTAFSRRCSEPNILSVGNGHGQERSHDDSEKRVDFLEQSLKKPMSDDSFLLPEREGAEPELALQKLAYMNMESSGYLNTGNRANRGSTSMCSSSCSLESAASNQSDGSVFTSSPRTSPSCPRRANSIHHSAKPRQEMAVADTVVKRRSQSMKGDGKGLIRSMSSRIRGSLKKGEHRKERCGTLEEDSQKEAESPGGEPSPRQRPLSAIEFFPRVLPPSYDQAVQSAAEYGPQDIGSMRVQDAARKLGRKSRPASMNEDFLSTYPVNHYRDCFSLVPEDITTGPEQCLLPFRPRTLSESVSRSRQDTVSRRCSQPVFEEYPYAKESYV